MQKDLILANLSVSELPRGASGEQRVNRSTGYKERNEPFYASLWALSLCKLNGKTSQTWY